MNDVLAQLAGQIDSLLWLGFAAFALWRFERPLSEVIRSLRLKSLKAGAMTAEFEQAETSMRKAAARASKGAEVKVASTVRKHQVRITSSDQSNVLARAAARADALTGRRVLWVDDEPDNNRLERHMLEALELQIETVTSTAAAQEALQSNERSYDLLLSDIKRPESNEAGLELLAWMRDEKIDLPTIFYVTLVEVEKPLPVGAFGLTNRPDELLHLAIDALERRHG